MKAQLLADGATEIAATKPAEPSVEVVDSPQVVEKAGCSSVVPLCAFERRSRAFEAVCHTPLSP